MGRSDYNPETTAAVRTTLAIALRSFGPGRAHLTVVGGLARECWCRSR